MRTKIFAVLLAAVLLTMTAMPSFAQGRNRSFWEKHRDKITVAGGALGGAVIGGLIGGKKGAAIGTIAGAGGSAVYTYKIRDRRRPYWR
jgi:uncharacterized protein YcfJ